MRNSLQTSDISANTPLENKRKEVGQNRMNLSKDNVKKIIFILCAVVLFYEVIENVNGIIDFCDKMIALVFPFILGCAIAFIINVPMRQIEKHLFPKKTSEKAKKIRRALALVLTIIAVLGVLTVAIWIVVPEIVNTISEISGKLPGAMERLTEKLDKLIQKYPEVETMVKDVEINWQEVLSVIGNTLKDGAGIFISSGVGLVSSVVSGVTSFVIGLVFAIYILLQKEKLSNQIKQVLYSFLSKKMTERIVRLGNIANQTFASFISGQCLEACILGVMFIITMTILDLPYALMMGVLIAITALIPIVGAFIGCFIGAILILIDSPVQALIFVIMFLVLQQIEGNLIYPHVVGNSVGLPSIWVLMAVTVGGNLMGVVGMIIFIPICSILYALFRDIVKRRLQERKIVVK